MISVIFGLMILAIFVISLSERFDIYEEMITRSTLSRLYILFIFIFQSLFNIVTINSCNQSNVVVMFIVSTIIPFLVMIVTSYIILLDIPGQGFGYWLNPFANTFGYFVTTLNGVRELTDELFIKSGGDKNADMNEVLKRINSDSSVIINTITVKSFESFLEKMKGVLTEDENKIKKLRKLVTMKHDVAFVMWIGIVGMLSYSIGNNYIISNNCNPSKPSDETTRGR